jgi:hypothetical protein
MFGTYDEKNVLAVSVIPPQELLKVFTIKPVAF